MLSVEPNLFFVDDKKNEVIDIVEIYRNKGYGVKYFNADPIDGDDVPFPNTYSDAVILFLDLYYNSDRILDEEKCAEWVSGIINKNSFFILVIWSQDTDEVDKVIDKIRKTERHPYVTIIKQKSDYQNGDNQWDFERLHTDIQNTLDESPELIELASWKKSIKCSSNVVIGYLSKGISKFVFKERLQKIIISHGGSYLLTEDKFNEKQDVLFDALDYVLSSNSKNTRPKKEVLKENKENIYNISSIPNIGADSVLNSWFHFKINDGEIDNSLILPGMICEFLDSDLSRKYGLKGDENFTKHFEPQIEESEKSNSKVFISDICVVISRPCDIAQNKFGKNIKLLCGQKITNPLRKSDRHRNIKTVDKKPDSIKIFDHLFFSEDENDICLIFDYRYILTLPLSEYKTKLHKIKIFNKELISEIQVEYSSYSNRLGITQII
ncbi:MAG: hypothetical protein JXB00_01410 [Bacteroidales bacterium]|nr:hypothetical protein [Bacteroidales bacterium]